VVAVGADTREEAEKLVREAIVMYVDDLKERGLPIPVRAVETRTIGRGEQYRHHKEVSDDCLAG